ncbi:hypothetical protein AYO40_05660 [Planctomycetaceae bacterium SCGC AG-212-D15]|nr:hypothetical protein AYO40_05660 [Planctomycetaceae bacterium SCGC AG-212-D15]
MPSVGSRASARNAYFIILGQAHLRYLLKEYETHHNLERSHQGVGNVPLTPQPQPPTHGAIECNERLGGLLKHYYSKISIGFATRSVIAAGSAGQASECPEETNIVGNRHFAADQC